MGIGPFLTPFRFRFNSPGDIGYNSVAAARRTWALS